MEAGDEDLDREVTPVVLGRADQRAGGPCHMREALGVVVR